MWIFCPFFPAFSLCGNEPYESLFWGPHPRAFSRPFRPSLSISTFYHCMHLRCSFLSIVYTKASLCVIFSLTAFLIRDLTYFEFYENITYYYRYSVKNQINKKTFFHPKAPFNRFSTFLHIYLKRGVKYWTKVPHFTPKIMRFFWFLPTLAEKSPFLHYLLL